MPSFLSRLRLPAALLFSFGLAACGGGGGGGEDGPANQDPDTPPTVVSTTPVENQDHVDPQVLIEFVFDKTIDPASVQLEDVILDSSSGDIDVRQVSAVDNRIVVRPRGLLARGALITARLQPTVADTFGNALENEFVLRFETEDVTEVASVDHTGLAGRSELGVIAFDSNGDGMSAFRVDQDRIYVRRIENGHPVGAATPIATANAGFPLPGNLDFASNGDAQLTYTTRENNRRLLRLRRWDEVTETWATPLNLTPFPLSQVSEYVSEVDNQGGMVAWSEESVNDPSKQAIRVGFPEANGFMEEPRTLRLADAERHGLRFERSGTQSVIAWRERDVSGGLRVAMLSHDRVTGFSSIQNPTAQGRIALLYGVGAATNGYRFVLHGVKNAADPDQRTLALSVAAPGQTFGLPLPVYNGEAGLVAGRLLVNDAGIAAVAYALADGTPGVWVRRYIPGTGFEAAVEITGVGGIPGGIPAEGFDVDLDSVGNALALVSHRGGAYGQVISAAVLPRAGAPQVGIVLDRAIEFPTSPEVRILRHPNSSAQMVWVHKDADQPSNYDVRTRRMAPNGVAGPITYYATETEEVTFSLTGGFAPSGRGVLLWNEMRTADFQVRQVRFFQ